MHWASMQRTSSTMTSNSDYLARLLQRLSAFRAEAGLTPAQVEERLILGFFGREDFQRDLAPQPMIDREIDRAHAS